MGAMLFKHDHLLAVGLTCCVPALRYVLHTCVFQPVAWRVLCSNAPTKATAIPAKTLHKMDKFCESMWKLTVYLALMALGIYALHDQQYLLDSRQFWDGWPTQSIPYKVRLYHTAEGAFYTASIFMLVAWEERRKDFHVMMLHHVATSLLIAASYSLSYARVGSVVMLLHDPSDVFLEAAKLCNYAELEGPSTVLFAGLLLSWFGLRLVLLPFWVMRSCIFGVQDVLGYLPRYNPVLTGILGLLVALHTYWFSLIAAIAWSKVTTGRASDTREDDE